MENRLQKIIEIDAFISGLGRIAALAGIAAPQANMHVSALGAASFDAGYRRGERARAAYRKADSVDYFVMRSQARLRTRGSRPAERAIEPVLLAW